MFMIFMLLKIFHIFEFHAITHAQIMAHGQVDLYTAYLGAQLELERLREWSVLLRLTVL